MERWKEEGRDEKGREGKRRKGAKWGEREWRNETNFSSHKHKPTIQVDSKTVDATVRIYVYTYARMYTVSKKQDTKLLPITSPNVNRFSKFFHWQTHW